jgi:hypothetical protein
LHKKAYLAEKREIATAKAEERLGMRIPSHYIDEEGIQAKKHDGFYNTHP